MGRRRSWWPRTWPAGGGTTSSPVILAPFVIFVGGVAQLLAATWAYRARDGLATAVHGVWGGFWFSWGVLVLLTASGRIRLATISEDAFGFWWIAAAFCTAGALLPEQSYSRVVLPLGRRSLVGNVPGHKVLRDIGCPAGMPGAERGQ
nr:MULTISPECIES: GPR1/FUN34/YaaH family transporter [Streptomyces]